MTTPDPATPERTPPDEIVEDGFGGRWVKHGPECDLQVVRPGKVQCGCDPERTPQDAATAPVTAEDGELIRLRNRIRALEASEAELLRRTEKAEAMTGDSREQIERIQAERDAMPEGERIRREALDAPLLRIQLAHFVHWKQRAEKAEAELAEAREWSTELGGHVTVLREMHRKAEAERDTLRAAAGKAFKKLHAMHLFGSSGPEFTDTTHREVLSVLADALDAPESPATASTAVSAATEAHGGAGEA